LDVRAEVQVGMGHDTLEQVTLGATRDAAPFERAEVLESLAHVDSER
jgi:hypothetical protein